MMVYEEAVRDGSLFEDEDLTEAYFAQTKDVRGLFNCLYGL